MAKNKGKNRARGGFGSAAKRRQRHLALAKSINRKKNLDGCTARKQGTKETL